jgi:hypothetical protein
MLTIPLGMIATVAWMTVTFWTAVTIFPGHLTGPPWGGEMARMKRKTQTTASNIRILLWGIPAAVAMAAALTMARVFWPGPYSHRFIFWVIAAFPIGLWAGHFIVRSGSSPKSGHSEN